MSRGPLPALAALASATLAAGCSIPPVQSGINPVNGCALDTDCPDGYHCETGACQLLPRSCVLDVQCDPGQSCQAGNCLPANRGFCEACDTSADCAPGGACVSFPGGELFCSTSCGASCQAVNGSCLDTTDADGADAGFTCLPSGLSCANLPDGGATVPATFSFINQNVFQGEGCTVCHSAGAGPPFASLDLVTDPWVALVGDGGGACANNIYGNYSGSGPGSNCPGGLLRVDPGNPQDSLLYIKLGLTQNTAAYGEPMPTATPGLTPPSLMKSVANWISAGAPNN